MTNYLKYLMDWELEYLSSGLKRIPGEISIWTIRNDIKKEIIRRKNQMEIRTVERR